ncbi:NAD(P)-binding protein [Ascobolus immersus RN42]|uniref:NAD(P)-binding protein n=1 Tax=Ascobolus immersus RN42 TaxID=1160509 RepID=A0A3N4I7I3_ASCIM|nr:NAD(P)-binding protein [Ascobolus immersus RN42]
MPDTNQSTGEASRAATPASTTAGTPAPAPAQHAAQKPRVWLITSILSPLGYHVAQEVLRLGDKVVGGCCREEFEVDRVRHVCRYGAVNEQDEKVVNLKTEGGDRMKFVELDVRTISLCQSAIADTIAAFGMLDVLLNCTTETYFGLLEDLPTHSILAQFERSYFGAVNIVKASLPTLRSQKKGHILCVTGSTGTMGNPGLSARSAADHALEGFLDALKFEIAPWDLRVTVIQPPFEANILANPLTLLPLPTPSTDLPAHYTTLHSLITSTYPAAPTPQAAIDTSQSPLPTVLSPPSAASSELIKQLTAETVEAILTVAGIQSPPVRVVVGKEGITAVLERIRTISEEMEEFLETSMAADVPIAEGETLPGLSTTRMKLEGVGEEDEDIE